ncbi:MAG: hypothetical protein ACI9V1_002896 [Spirosomataceae bacterium]|jgi:hypothetical protein
MMRLLIRLLIIGLLLLGGFYLWKKVGSFDIFGINEVETTHNIVLEKMQTLGQVELAKYTFKDVVEQKLTRDFLPDPKAILIVQGEAIGCIDLQKITTDNISVKGDTLIIRMPDPNLCNYKIDHRKSKIYHTEYAFMNEQLLLDEAYKRAEDQIYETALQSGILEQTKKNAELVLKPLFENLTGKHVILRYGMTAELSRPR